MYTVNIHNKNILIDDQGSSRVYGHFQDRDFKAYASWLHTLQFSTEIHFLVG
jgi:hypothetical protein